jgi:hypothetical protein
MYNPNPRPKPKNCMISSQTSALISASLRLRVKFAPPSYYTSPATRLELSYGKV